MKPEARARIERSVATHGYHLNVVQAGASPRFAYTIGLLDELGHELVFAGGVLYMLREVQAIVSAAVERLRSGPAPALDEPIAVPALGRFTLRAASADWVAALLLGAVSYYGDRPVLALQLVPDDDHWTLDVPKLSSPWSALTEPVWKWHYEEWPYPVPRKSVAATGLAEMRGAPILAASRWEDDYWELFAKPGAVVDAKDARFVPLGVLVAFDPSLEPVVHLEVGASIRRRDRGKRWVGVRPTTS